MNILTQVIAAVSTPPGKGGVAIIRMSGDGALEIAEKAFFALSRKKITDYPARTQIYGHIIYNEEKIDDVLLTHFPAPNSYTGEDTIEIGCHGGILVTRTVLEVLFALGSRPAEAGEFTRRAFVNGRLTLTEAEAISDLLEAKSREQMRLASDTSREKLSERISEIRKKLVDLMSSVYARIDYPDEDLGDFTDEEVLVRLVEILGRIDTLISTYRTGRAITDGIRTVICGKPNVGKSTLYNLLLGEDAAIVTDIEGTTRDVLERTVSLGRVMLRIADTAGIRSGENADAIERIGIEKSREYIKKSELLFALFDISKEFDEKDALILEEIKKSDAVKIAILNKCDAEKKFDEKKLSSLFEHIIFASAKSSDTELIGELTALCDKIFTDEKIVTGEDAIVSSARQHAALLRAREYISVASDDMKAGYPQDAVSSDIERALGAISELDGRAVSEEIVSDIFSKFCVGK